MPAVSLYYLCMWLLIGIMFLSFTVTIVFSAYKDVIAELTEQGEFEMPVVILGKAAADAFCVCRYPVQRRIRKLKVVRLAVVEKPRMPGVLMNSRSPKSASKATDTEEDRLITYAQFKGFIDSEIPSEAEIEELVYRLRLALEDVKATRPPQGERAAESKQGEKLRV